MQQVYLVQLLIKTATLRKDLKQLMWGILSTLLGFAFPRAALYKKGMAVWAAKRLIHILPGISQTPSFSSAGTACYL